MLTMSMRIAFRALFSNKARSFLTMLGIIIGVAAVIVMVALGQGASASVQARIASLGTNVLYLYPGSSQSGGVRGGSASVQTLTQQDSEAIQRDASSLRYLSPVLRHGYQVVNGNQNWFTNVQGVGVD